MQTISIIIPCFNNAEFIEECLKSICSQSIVDELEIILVDDGSTDESSEKAYKFLEANGRLQQANIIVLPENKGVANARITGIKAATGKYIMSVDADDWIADTMCERMLQKAIINKCDVVVCDYNMVIDGNAHVQGPCYREPFLQQLILCNVSGSLCNKLIESSILKCNSFQFPIHDFSEDYTYSLQVAIKANNIGYVPEALYFYRRRTDSFVRNKTPEMILKRYNDDMANFAMDLNILESYGLRQKYQGEIVAHKLKMKNTYRNHPDLWYKTFPELNTEIFKSEYISLRSKLAYFLKLYGLK